MIVQAGSGKGLGVGGPFVEWLGLGASTQAMSSGSHALTTTMI